MNPKDKKNLKEFLLKILNEIKSSEQTKTAPAPVKTPTPTIQPGAPSPKRRRELVPVKWPEQTPGPEPKAEGKEVGIEEVIKEMKMFEELAKMKRLIFENKQITQEMSMNIEDPDYEMPHPSVQRGIEGGKKTPFSGSKFFDDGEELDYTTLEKLGSEEFNKIIRDVKPFGKMNTNDFMKAFQLMSSIEMPHAAALEELAIRKVKEQFGLPDEVSDKLEVKLVRHVDRPSEDSDNLAQDVIQDLEFTDEEKEIIHKHVDKRVLQNSMMMGAGFRSHSTFNSIKNDLDAIDPRLHPLYEKTMPNVALFMWQTPLEDMMGGVTMMGLSKIKKDENNNVKAEAVATIFPILLHETAKAAIELLFANYIISLTERFGANVASEIIKQSDVFEDEIWHKRIGPQLWKLTHDAINFVIVHEKESNYTLVAYLLSDISMMEPDEFINFMNTVIYDGEGAIRKISGMIDKIEAELATEENVPEEVDEDNLDTIIHQANAELNQLSTAAKEKEESIETTPKDWNSMNLKQLQAEVALAVSEERYEDAAEITKIIKTKV